MSRWSPSSPLPLPPASEKGEMAVADEKTPDPDEDGGAEGAPPPRWDLAALRAGSDDASSRW
jgi:hypothetical protein